MYSHPSAALLGMLDTPGQDNIAQCLPDALRVRISVKPCSGRDSGLQKHFCPLSESLQHELLPGCPAVLMEIMFERENKTTEGFKYPEAGKLNE